MAASVPVITGEVGEFDCRRQFLDGYLPWADVHHVGYLAWAWNAGDCASEPALLSRLNGTRSPYGIGFYQHLVQVQ